MLILFPSFTSSSPSSGGIGGTFSWSSSAGQTNHYNHTHQDEDH